MYNKVNSFFQMNLKQRLLRAGFSPQVNLPLKLMGDWLPLINMSSYRQKIEKKQRENT